MEIIITTFKREDKIRCIEQIPKSLYKYVNLFTRKDRVDILQEHIPKGIKIIANPMDIDGIADIRQRCIDKVKKGKVWVIDDQVQFEKRKSKTFTDKDFSSLYNQLSKWLDNYCQVGISPRAFSNYEINDVKEFGRIYSTYGLRTDIMQKVGARFDTMYRNNKKIKYVEDLYLTLYLLTRGFKNLLIYNYHFNYRHNTAGGNSSSRTLGQNNESMLELQRYFPKYVKIYKKLGKAANVGGANYRNEVKIQWKKAYMGK